MDIKEFDIIGDGISSLLVLWNTINDNDNDNLINSNRNINLKEIYCQRNKMKSGTELDKCLSVNFHCNLLKNLNGLPHLPRIKEMNLSSNNLGNEELTQLSLLPTLTSLDISANKFNSISILPFMPSLLKLSIAYNPIKTLEDINENVPSLEYLDIRGNSLNNSSTDKFSYLRSRRRVIVPLKGLTKIRELYITMKQVHDNSKSNRYDNNGYANDIYNLTQQVLSLEIVDGMSPMDWKADADEEMGVVYNTNHSNTQPQRDIDGIATPRFDQVSSIFKSKLLNESVEKPDVLSIIEEGGADDSTDDNNDNSIVPLIKTDNNANDAIDNDLSAFSTSSSPMMKTNVIMETKHRDTDIGTLNIDKSNNETGHNRVNTHIYDVDDNDNDDIVIRVDRSTGQIVSRKKGSPMLMLLTLFKQSMKFENRQLYLAIKKWRNETKPKTIEYTNIINNLTANNNDLLASLENEREKHRTMTKEWEKRLEVEKNKYSNASKKVLQQEAMLMSIRRDLEEKIRYNTQVEVNNIKDISSYKDTIINKDAEMDILKKQLADSRIAIESSNKREEELQNKLMIENEKEIRFKEKYDEWMSSREALIQSVEQSQSALSLALEREATLTSSCEEYRSIINSLKEQAISLEKKVTTCNEQIGIVIITIIIVILIDIIAMQETDLSNAKTGNDSKTKELEEASNLNSKLMKRLQDTQKAFEESLTELSSLSKKYNDMSKQKDVYCNTINSLRLCVRKMQESLQGTNTLYIINIIIVIND